jgi:hypothetical protein
MLAASAARRLVSDSTSDTTFAKRFSPASDW